MTQTSITHPSIELSPVPPLRTIHHCANYMIFMTDDAACSICGPEEDAPTEHPYWESDIEVEDKYDDPLVMYRSTH